MDWGAFVADDPEEYEAIWHVEGDFAAPDDVVDAAADWLAVNASVPHDGAWAANAIRTLAAALRA